MLSRVLLPRLLSGKLEGIIREIMKALVNSFFDGAVVNSARFFAVFCYCFLKLEEIRFSSLFWLYEFREMIFMIKLLAQFLFLSEFICLCFALIAAEMPRWAKDLCSPLQEPFSRYTRLLILAPLDQRGISKDDESSFLLFSAKSNSLLEKYGKIHSFALENSR